MKNEMPDVIKYLLGEAPLNGHWFGEDRPPEGKPFWWRKFLREAWNTRADIAPSGEEEREVIDKRASLDDPLESLDKIEASWIYDWDITCEPVRQWFMNVKEALTPNPDQIVMKRSEVKEILSVLKPFADALDKAENLIKEGSHYRFDHVIRVITFWLSYNDFLETQSVSKTLEKALWEK